MTKNTPTELLVYLLIDKRLRQEVPPSLEDLKEFLSTSFEEVDAGRTIISRLSIKGDIKRMRRLFHAPIGFTFDTNSYHYNSSAYSLLKLPDAILDSLITNLKLNLLLGARFTNLENIKNERVHACAHEESIPAIAKAFVEKRELRIMYKSLGSKRSREYFVAPHLLKVIQGKWVLYGKSKDILKGYLLEEFNGMPEVTETKADIPTIKEIEKQIEAISNPQ